MNLFELPLHRHRSRPGLGTVPTLIVLGVAGLIVGALPPLLSFGPGGASAPGRSTDGAAGAVTASAVEGDGGPGLAGARPAWARALEAPDRPRSFGADRMPAPAAGRADGSAAASAEAFRGRLEADPLRVEIMGLEAMVASRRARALAERARNPGRADAGAFEGSR